jgi:hypothetical protein
LGGREAGLPHQAPYGFGRAQAARTVDGKGHYSDSSENWLF